MSTLFIAVLTLVAALSSFLSFNGVAALLCLWRLPIFDTWWWLILVAQFIRWRATVSAVENNRIGQIAPPFVIVLDLLAAGFIWISAAWAVWHWVRP